MNSLLDACILSKLLKIAKQADVNLERWVEKHHESSYFINALTIGEIRSGISKLNLKKEEERQKRLVIEN